EHCFRIAGACFDVAAMRLRDFTGDKESEPEAAVRIVAQLLPGATAERVKDPVQSRFLDCRASIADLKENARRLANDGHVNRRVRRSVLDRVYDQVGKQLLQAPPVPEASSAA